MKLDVVVADGRVTIAGKLDDTVSLANIPPQVTGDVVIDTSGVTFVNSLGMREWILFLRALGERGSRVTLERVAAVLMTQMNLILEAAEAASIVSFHAQYECPKCGNEVTPVVDAVANAAMLQQMQAPALPCPECGAAMELADFPERYLTIFRG